MLLPLVIVVVAALDVGANGERGAVAVVTTLALDFP